MKSVCIEKNQGNKVHHFCCSQPDNPIRRSWKCICRDRVRCRHLSLPLLSLLTIAVVVLSPSLSWALQTHDAPEGLFVHQMAHVLFMAALAYLAWDIHRNAFTGRGWFYLQLFCLFMFIWNGLAFAGHAIAHHLIRADFFTETSYFFTRMSGPFTPAKLFYYVAKLDHLVSVPALLFLFLALRTFYHSIDVDESKGEDA